MIRNFTLFFPEILRSRKHFGATVFLLLLLSVFGGQEVLGQCTPPDAPTADLAQPTCTVATGTITVTAPTGTSSSYNVNGGAFQTSTIFSNLAPGFYDVRVKEGECISDPTRVEINAQPITPDAPTADLIQPNCTVATGTITITAPTGYSYSIDGTNYTTSMVFNNVAPGTYNVTAKTDAGCVSNPTTITINDQPITPDAPTADLTQPTCTVATGTITVTAPTGTSSSYNVNGGAFQTSTIFSNLAPGFYDVRVKEGECISDPTRVEIKLQPITPDAPTTDLTQPTCTVATGTITVTAPTGYSYSIDGTNYTTSMVFNNVAPGTYNVTAKTDAGCVSNPTTVTINDQPITPAPAGIITGNTTVCYGASGVTYTIEAVTGATSYKWTVPAGAIFTQSSDGKAITVSFRTAAVGAATIGVTPINGLCYGTGSNLSITITSKPAAAGPITGVTDVCSGEKGVVYSVGAVSGAESYIWTVPPGASFVQSSDGRTITVDFTTTTAGTKGIYVTPRNQCGDGARSEFITTVYLPAAPNITSGLKSSKIENGTTVYQYYTGESATNFTGNAENENGMKGSFQLIDKNGNIVQSSLTNSFLLTPCNREPGLYTLRYFRTDSFDCKNFRDYSIRINRSVYTVISIADPFTICRGTNINFTAQVYRDVEVIYPYTNRPITDVIEIRENAEYNPAYSIALGREPSEIEKAFPQRLLQPIIRSAVPNVSLNNLRLNSDLFNFQWERNGKDEGPNRDWRNVANLSATDYVRVRVTPKNTFACMDPYLPPSAKGGISSNYLYFAEPSEYNITLSASTTTICKGEDVTFTALKGGNLEFWNTASAQLTWVLTRKDGSVYVLQVLGKRPVLASDPPRIPLTEDDFILTHNEIKAALSGQIDDVDKAQLIDGDQIRLDYTSDIEALATSSKCTSKIASTAAITITVHDFEVFMTTLIDDICVRGTASFTANVTTTGTPALSYTWTVNNSDNTYVKVYTTTSSTLNLSGDETATAGTYSVSVEVSSETCPSLEAQEVAVGTLTIDELTKEEGILTIYWDETYTKWDVYASPSGSMNFGSNPIYIWYRQEDPTQPEVMVQSGASNYYREESPTDVLRLRVQVSNYPDCILNELTNDNVIPLPVDMLYITAEIRGANVVLNWATKKELNNTGFEVQVSNDGQQFRKLAFIETRDGNASYEQRYQYIDVEKGKTGTRYYRLKQIDVDTKFEFFGPVVVDLGSKNLISVSPNPFDGEFEVKVETETEGEVYVTVTTSVGIPVIAKSIKVEQGVNTQLIQLNPSLPSGIYIVTTRMNGTTKHFRLMKQ
ncbi:T9SS type A sorting domain-containing protein [Cesiribacter sp. SM1]|uniref:T9SS type A sorting domain-containing protein n=1 Tax=Cesiribacter sp. SM1 TaxID=2861196 RepID=UPI001CD7CFA2|nr:T9SS type A sorting domain-containing protein [Cesiribacter sp. SM1]